ncbi:SixA phosphatase family protein [Qipengyuania sp. ASV99]|uniref:SixA phosphatase family protein n=1 Tax=Qipengyuania sp. ASV99 TaxID=3399681 RepID=UPI003A4C685F
MKILGLFRHAKSEWDDTVKRDFDRTLNARGRRGAEVMGDHIRAHGIRWDRLIASPAARVTETLTIGLPEMPVILDQRLYLASTDTIIEVAQSYAGDGDSEAEAILMSGHNPGLQEMILELVSPSHENELFREACVKFPTASYAVLECNVDHWANLKPRCAKLVHFARPRDIDAELGPEY